MDYNKNLLIDTHAHVNFLDFNGDYKDVIKRALDGGVGIINVGSNGADSKRAVEIANEYESGVYATVGLHPGGKEEFDYDYFLNLAKNKKVVGIGECGLDYYRSPQSQNLNLKNKNWKKKQKEVFVKHLELAKEVSKPIIVHCRDAHEDLLEILRLEDSLPIGVMHFFTGTLEQAKKYIDLGFYISFSGVITFPPPRLFGGQVRRASANAYDEIVKNIPSERILIETDCPYVAPVPYRGKRNEPLYVKYVAQKIAYLRGISFEEVAEQTTKNAQELFKI